MDVNSETLEPIISATSVDEAPASSSADVALLSEVIAALRYVHDPEIPVNIYDLGLIYRIDVRDPGIVEIDMTLTAPACPVAGEMVGWVKAAIDQIKGVSETTVNLVFDPPWDQSRMSEEAKLELGLE